MLAAPRSSVVDPLPFISPIPGTAVPLDHPLEKGDDVLGEHAEQSLRPWRRWPAVDHRCGRLCFDPW